MSTALEQMHEIEPHIRSGRARAGVLMLILSDALSVVAILAAGGYLSALNVSGQFRAAGEHAPALLPGVLLAIFMVLSGLAYYWWQTRVLASADRKQGAIFILSLICMVAALLSQIWIGVTLGFASPFHAYASLVLLLTWYSAFHFALTALIGVLLLGRIVRGRLVERDYIVEVVGYWWYYTVIAGLLMLLFSMVIT
jgi:hypothetical protein